MSGGREQGTAAARESQAYLQKADASVGQAAVAEPVVGCNLSIQIQIVPSPASPLPGAQSLRQDEKEMHSFIGIDEKTYRINLDKGGLISRDDLCSRVPAVYLRLPQYGEGDDALEYKQHSRMDLGGFEAGKKYVVIVRNEVPEAAEYMVNEMLTNAKSQHVQDMLKMHQQANELERKAGELSRKASRIIREQVRQWLQPAPAEATKAMNQSRQLMEQSSDIRSQAEERYRSLVDYDEVWDHKPKFIRKGLGAWHTWGKWEYYYDVWSNIHYGYVGRAAGFSVETLVSRAELAGRWNDIKKLNLLSAWKGDPTSDVVAIKIGCRMYDTNESVTVSSLIGILEQTPEFVRRPRSYNSNENLQSIYRR